MRPAYERFTEKVDFSGECWQWTAALTSYGYGSFDGRSAHRWAWETVYGAIPDGLEIDHTCHNDSGCAGGVTCPHRACVNVSHMELVTNRENRRRGNRAGGGTYITHCPRGHEYNEENTRMNRGKRHCRACEKMRNRRLV